MKNILVLFLSFYLFSCGDNSHPEAGKVRSQLPLRKVVKVEASDILFEAEQKADSAFSLTRPLSLKEWNVKTGFSIYLMSDSAQWSNENKSLLEAYNYSKRSGVKGQRNVQQLSNGDFNYSEFLVTADSLQILAIFLVQKEQVVKQIIQEK